MRNGLLPGRHGPSAAPARRAVAGAAVLAAVAIGCGGCASSGSFDRALPGAPGPAPGPPAARQHERPGRHAQSAPRAPRAPRALPRLLPGLGTRMLQRVPEHSRQVLLVTGSGRNASSASAVLETRTDDGWRAGESWPARNAHEGWTDDHHADDLRSPIGVYTLTDAGGASPDPGTRLPYDHSRDFEATGTGFNGESLAGSFAYVIAIDYNRRPGTSPLDWTRPLGEDKGGGIWLHVAHQGGPTHGCIALSEDHMRELMRLLDPDLHPVIVMGDAASLAR